MRNPIGCVGVGLIAVFMIGGAYAQGGLKDLPQGKWWTNARVIAELNLSADQRSKIEDLWIQTRRTVIDPKAELEKRQLDLSELLSKDSVDVSAALKAFDRVQEAKLSLERSTFLMRIQIKNLLSPDQQQKLETIAERQRQLKAKAGGTLNPAPAGKQPINKKAGVLPHES